MLNSLHIQNIAIIDQLDVDFDLGFTVLTGETGAGKSIIIDSILLLLGNKASKDLIRSGESFGLVNASFSSLSKEALEILSENGLSPDDDGNITVSRKIGLDGRNTAKINGISVTVTLLKQLGEHLINIHGQHDGVLLLDSKRHLGYLDEYGVPSEIMERYKTTYIKVKELRNQLNQLKLQEAQKEERIQKITLCLEKLDACDLKAGEHQELLLKSKNLIKNAEIVEGLHTAATAIYDAEMPAVQLVHEALDALISIEALIPNGTDTTERLRRLAADLDDLGAELGKTFDSYASEQMDPKDIEERLDQIESIKKEFGPTDEDVINKRNAYQNELNVLEQSESIIQKTEHDFSTLLSELEKCAAELTNQRKKAAVQLEEHLKNELCYLDMPKVRLSIRVQDRLNDRGGVRYRPDGKDDVEFFLSANAGEELRPLAKIASGGELSRIMLSMKSALNQDFDAVVYDEVDTGVSGATADKIGKKLQQSAEGRQVFCITHLAQIAARADHHLKVCKTESNGRISSGIYCLSDEERIKEVARIMGGVEVTESILNSAKEIIQNSKKMFDIQESV